MFRAAILLLATLSSTAFAQEADDIRLLDVRARTPTEVLTFSADATDEVRLMMSDIAGWYGHALFHGNEERLACLDGKEDSVRDLLRAMEYAQRDLPSSVFQARYAKVERESRTLHIAFDRAQRLHRESLECHHLVSAPIEPKRMGRDLPPAEDDFEYIEIDVMDGAGAVPW